MEQFKVMDTLTPRQIVAELDKYIIGQNTAKRMVAYRFKKPLEKETGP